MVLLAATAMWRCAAGRHQSLLPGYLPALLARQLSALAAAAREQQQHHHQNSSSAGAAAAAAALASAAAALVWLPPPARADAAADATAAASKQQRFADWMASHGADMSAAAVRPCQDGAGLGLFATPELRSHMTHKWLGRRVGSLLLRGAEHQTVPVASVPLQLCLTVEAAVADATLGDRFAQLLEQGALDERSAVVLLLLLESGKGDASAYAPWLQLLPASFDGPLFYSEQQMQELAGTTLAAATAARKAALQRQWEQLQPVAAELAQQAGVAAPSFDGFLWATSIFWSRALALPVAYTQPGGSAAVDDDSDSSSVVHIKVLEGLVPGVDLANHSSQPKCWWEVEAAPTASQQQQDDGEGSSGATIKLLANRACLPQAGEELTISYGDKGNEELLLLYGFAQRHNPHEALMLLCPLPPPEEWDEVFSVRMQLLQAKGLRPQFFLPTSHYEAVTGQQLSAAPAAPADDASAAGSRRLSSSARRAGSSIVPSAAREVLEVFVLDRSELAAAASAGQGAGQQQGAGSSSTQQLPDVQDEGDQGEDDAVQRHIEQLGLSMAVLTTFVRLLELKLIGMEGPEGTGALEGDLQLLQEQQHGGAAQPAWLRHCLHYRAGQKALVRGYLTEGRAELQDTLKELQALLELRGEFSE